MYDFISSLNISEELKANEIYYLFKSDLPELNLTFISSLQKFKTTEDILNHYTNENTKYFFDIFNDLPLIVNKICKYEQNIYSEKYISGISKIVFLFLLIQKNIESLGNLFKETKNYIQKFYIENQIQSNLKEKINTCLNDLINSSLLISQRNYSRRPTKEMTVSSLDNINYLLESKEKNDSKSYLNEQEFIFPEIKTPKFEEEEENNLNEKDNFEYIKEAINNGVKIKRMDSSLTLSKMNFVLEQDLKPISQLEKGKSYDNYTKPNNKKKTKKNKKNLKTSENVEILDKNKNFLSKFLSETNNLYKENEINLDKKIELKQIILSDYKELYKNFYNSFDEYKSLNENIKNFLMKYC